MASFVLRYRGIVSLHFFFACGSPQVSALVFPAVGIEAGGTVRGFMDAQSLTTTNRQAIEKRTGLRVIDSRGRENRRVEESARQGD